MCLLQKLVSSFVFIVLPSPATTATTAAATAAATTAATAAATAAATTTRSGNV